MSGLQIIIPSTFTGSGLPILRDDKILTAGSLMLLDMAHSAGSLVGVPTDGATVPNIAWREAAAVLGSGTASTLASIYNINASFASADGRVERSGKGGLHVEIKQSGYTNGRGANIRAATAIEAYLQANPAHKFYYSRWSRITRVATAGSPAESFSMGIVNGDTAGGFSITNSRLFGRYRSGYTYTESRASPGFNTAGNTFEDMANAVWSGTAPALTFCRVYPQIWGNYQLTAISAGQAHPSSILYRSYLEDLTVSGRAYADVDALDYALWQAAFANGGRFYNDTFTAPT